MLNAMRTLGLILLIAYTSSWGFSQAFPAPPAFEVASVKAVQQNVGPDYNNQITTTNVEFLGKNVTLKRLVAEAYHLQINQVFGPSWIDQNEYDIDARAASGTTSGQMAQMLQRLLAERFSLKEHSETREMRVYELVVAKSGAKITPEKNPDTTSEQGGFHFHGDLHHFADLLAVQLSIPAPDNPGEPVRASTSPVPVLDKTGLPGTFDFGVDVHPELGTDLFTTWQRALQEQLGLRIENRKGAVPVLVVDDAARIPTEN